MEIKIESLHIYPLKSAKGVSLDKMDLLKTGPQWDRQWMLIDSDNDFISQRKLKSMCLIEQKITQNFLELSAPNMETLQIPLEESLSQKVSVSIFNKPTEACLVGRPFDQWFSDFLHQEVSLVRSPEESSRWTSGNHGPKTEILFADGYPLLLTTQETLNELNSKLPETVPMDRFRPNIVVSGAKANAEEEWKKFNIGPIKFASVKACSRCSIITVNQKTSESNNQIVRTLNSYRKKDNSIIFGRNLIHDKEGTINVGESLQLN